MQPLRDSKRWLPLFDTRFFTRRSVVWNEQLGAPVELSESATMFDSLGVLLMDVFFWFAIVGALTFWVLIPAVRRASEALDERAG